MKLSVLQENLSSSLSVALRSVSLRPSLPVLSHILLSAENGRLKISSTNLEMGITVWVGAKIENEGQITVPAKVFYDFISSLPPGAVELELEDTLLKISSVSYNASINTIPASEFPPLPDVTKGFTFDIPKTTFGKMVSQVAFSAAGDDGRPVLTAVLTTVTDYDFQMAATDGYRLSVKKTKLDREFDKDIKLLLPAKTLAEVSKIISEEGKKGGKDNETLSISIISENKQVAFRVGDTELISRLIEGQFPNYEKIIPTSFTTSIMVDREEFLKAVRIASIFAKDSANIVKLHIDPKDGKMIKLSANASGVGGQESVVEAEIQGDGGDVAFNAKYLTDFLTSVSSSQIQFQISGALNPGLFKSLKDEDYIHVIMPVRVNE